MAANEETPLEKTDSVSNPCDLGPPIVCKFHLEGKCRFGSDCRNLHPDLCKSPPTSPRNNKHRTKNKSNGGRKTIVEDKPIMERKPSMKTADHVINRILWDETFPQDRFTVGYLDRFLGIIEKPFHIFSWEDIASVDINVLAIPKHRIQYFKYGGSKVWDKNERLDLVFGSTKVGNEGPDVYEVMRLVDAEEDEAKKSEACNQTQSSLTEDEPNGPPRDEDCLESNRGESVQGNESESIEEACHIDTANLMEKLVKKNCEIALECAEADSTNTNDLKKKDIKLVPSDRDDESLESLSKVMESDISDKSSQDDLLKSGESFELMTRDQCQLGEVRLGASTRHQDSASLDSKPIANDPSDLTFQCKLRNEHLRPTHFLCVRVTDPTVVSNLKRVKDYMSRCEPQYENCLISDGNLHFTIALLCLDDDTANLQIAKDVIQEMVAELSAIQLMLQGLEIFHQKVLIAKVELTKELENFIIDVNERLEWKGVVTIVDHSSLKPHVTILKTSHQLRKEKRIIDPLFIRPFCGKVFGEFTLDNLTLCKMAFGQDGLYETITVAKIGQRDDVKGSTAW